MINKPVRFFVREKRGQITLFIIGAILILLILLSLSYIREYVIKEKAAVPQPVTEEFTKDTEGVKAYIESCIQSVTLDGLQKLGLQGGYIDVPLMLRHGGTSFWLLDQRNEEPFLEDEITPRFINFLNSNLSACTHFDIYRERGFEITAQPVSSYIEFGKENQFGKENVFINISYPITLKKGNLERKFDNFYKNYEIRFRTMFELATQINTKSILLEDFNVYRPLDLIEWDRDQYEITTTPFSEDSKIIIFTIRDKTRTGLAKDYTFRFASRFGRSFLDKPTELSPASNIFPNLLEYVIRSPDGLALLTIRGGTLVSGSFGGAVNSINVQQTYPDYVVMKDVPIDDDGGTRDVIRRTKWPVYHYSPDATFTPSAPLRIYWDNERRPRVGEVGLLYSSDGQSFRPITARKNYFQNYIEADRQSLSDYVAVDCGTGNLDNPIQPTPTLPGPLAPTPPGTPQQPVCGDPATIPNSNTDDSSDYLNSQENNNLEEAGADSSYNSSGYEQEPIEVQSDAKAKQSGMIPPVCWVISLFSDAESKKDCVEFTPTCDGQVEVKEEPKDGEGECSGVDDGQEIKGGQKYEICAKVKKCDRKFFKCVECTMECTATFI